MWQEKKINLGETRLVYLDVVNPELHIVPPPGATWELTEYETGLVESGGECRIEIVEGGFTLYALVTPRHTGLYRLIYTFDVGEERRRPCLIIKVR